MIKAMNFLSSMTIKLREKNRIKSLRMKNITESLFQWTIESLKMNKMAVSKKAKEKIKRAILK